MEVGRETRTKDVIAKKFVSNRVDSIVKEIHNEYCLKQSKFNPTGKDAIHDTDGFNLRCWRLWTSS